MGRCAGSRGAIWTFEEHRRLRGPYGFCQEDGQPLTAGMTERIGGIEAVVRVMAGAKGA